MNPIHTPTPWTVTADGYDRARQGFRFIIQMPPGKAQAVDDCRFIERTVDSHNALVEALKIAAHTLETVIALDPANIAAKCAVQRACAVIAFAEVKP